MPSSCCLQFRFQQIVVDAVAYRPNVYLYVSVMSPCDTSYLLNLYTTAFHCSQGVDVCVCVCVCVCTCVCVCARARAHACEEVNVSVQVSVCNHIVGGCV